MGTRNHSPLYHLTLFASRALPGKRMAKTVQVLALPRPVIHQPSPPMKTAVLSRQTPTNPTCTCHCSSETLLPVGPPAPFLTDCFTGSECCEAHLTAEGSFCTGITALRGHLCWFMGLRAPPGRGQSGGVPTEVPVRACSGPRVT